MGGVSSHTGGRKRQPGPIGDSYPCSNGQLRLEPRWWSNPTRAEEHRYPLKSGGTIMTIKVLLADDHTIVRDGLCALLEADPAIRVVGNAANSRKAIDQIEELQPAVVVMDISMPELNGIDATRKIQAISPQVRVIILSMLGTADH